MSGISKGVSFGGTHSYRDLNLILSKVDTPPAEPKTVYVDIPGGNGSLDFTEACGGVKFKDRTLTFTFTMRPDDTMTWEKKQAQVANALNGRKMSIIVDDDPDTHYSGRVTVSNYVANKKIRQIVITARVSPFKSSNNETVRTINLSETGSSVSLYVTGNVSVVPSIKVSNWVEISGDGVNIKYDTAGTYKNPSLTLKPGSNSFLVKGVGTVTFTWTEGV